MTVQTLFDTVDDIDDPAVFRFAVVAECWRCGARSEPIVQIDEFDKPHLWAIVALAQHDREVHADVAREVTT